MYSLKINCRLITPMFMAGADGRTPELRPSEFKGMMRWWWRAIKAEDDIEKLKKEEVKIFGGTGEGEGRSKVKVVINFDPIQFNEHRKDNLKSWYQLNWRFDRNGNTLVGNDAGIGYLFYSTVLPNREKQFIKDGFEFDIQINSFDNEAFRQAIASLWLAIYLGGFGTRARRGGGNITVVPTDQSELFDNKLDFFIRGNDQEAVAKWLVSNFKKVSKIINGSECTKNFAYSYSNLSFSRFIISSQNFTSWKDALSELGKIYSDFRTVHKVDIFDVGAFGLPVVHRSRNSTLKPKNHERRSSPLIFKVLESSGRFYWLVIRMSGEFLPRGEVLEFREKTQKSDYRLIDKFWEELKNNGQEFILSKPEIIDTITEKIIKDLNPIKIVLFGSRARGDATKGSDIDIAIEGEIPLSLLELSAPCDIVQVNKVGKRLKEKIQREGIVIYEREG